MIQKREQTNSQQKELSKILATLEEMQKKLDRQAAELETLK